MATGQSFDKGSMLKSSRILLISASLVVFALVVGAFVALYLHEDPRSWQFATYEDGTTIWQSVIPATPGFSGGNSNPGVVSEGGMYVSNIITDDEAKWGAGLLAVAWVGFVLLGSYSARTQRTLRP